MLTIRLARGGAKKRPYYHIVVAEKSFARDGRFLERIGASNPFAAGDHPVLTLDAARYAHWLAQGAQPSPTVKRLVRQYAKEKSAPAKPADKAAAA